MGTMFIQSYDMPKMKNGTSAMTSRREEALKKNNAKISRAITTCSGRKPMHSAVTASHRIKAPAHHADSRAAGMVSFIYGLILSALCGCG